MTDIIDPFILFYILMYVEKDYTQKQIIEEYENELDLDPEFISEINTCYDFATKYMRLRPYQNICIREAIKYYEDKPENSNYQIRWCCGLGKTRTACSILKLANFKSICVGLPSILLVEQFYQEIKNFYPNVNILKVGGGTALEGDSTQKKVSPKTIKKYLQSDDEYKIILTTYHSSSKILNEGFTFDICVADEAHHLESKTQKLFSNFLKIECRKKLLLTATPNLDMESSKLYSFTNSTIFQGLNNTKSVKWSIENGFIANYRLVILNLSQLDIEDFDTLYHTYQDVNLILTAYSAVKAIYQGISKKMLIYCNRVENAQKVEYIIDELLNEYNACRCSVNPDGLDFDIVNEELNGTNSQLERNKVMNNFKRAEVGIISSVQLFGEGFDYPGLDTVIFAEKMTSDIRIIQSGLRPCRRDYNNPGKVANIIIPIQEGDISKPKQVLNKLKEIDDIRGKISMLNNNSFNRKDFIRLIKRGYAGLSNPSLKKIFRKIELELLEDTRTSDITIPNMLCSKIESGNLEGLDIEKKDLYYYIILVLILNNIMLNRGKEFMLQQLKINYGSKENHNKRGFRWVEKLGISLVGCDANKTLREIIRLCTKNNINLDLDINLKNGEKKKVNITDGIYTLN